DTQRVEAARPVERKRRCREAARRTVEGNEHRLQHVIHLHAYETPAGGQKAAKAALVGLVWLLEVSVTGDAATLMLEIVVVVAMFVLMLGWLRVNRGQIELAETRVTRREAASRFVA